MPGLEPGIHAPLVARSYAHEKGLAPTRINPWLEHYRLNNHYRKVDLDSRQKYHASRLIQMAFLRFVVWPS